MFGPRTLVNASAKIQNQIKKNNSLVCVGLDPEYDLVKGRTLSTSLKKAGSQGPSLFEFNEWIIDQTADLVCAYKPNIAFYEAEGASGLSDLKKTIEYLQSQYPQIPVILDAKRADVPNTARMYAKSAFEYWQADAVTVYPHLGFDSVEPFLKYKDKLTILLFKTSNPDSGIFQNLEVHGEPYYLKIAQEIKKWKDDNIGIFVGATYPNELATLRKIFPDKMFLSAGIGAQSAQIEKAVKAGVDKSGAGIMFNASRSIIYDQSPRKAAQKLKDEINKYRTL